MRFEDALQEVLIAARSRGINSCDLHLYVDRIFWFNIPWERRADWVDNGGLLEAAEIHASTMPAHHCFGAHLTDRRGWTATVEERR